MGDLESLGSLGLLLLSLLGGEEDGVDVGDDTSVGNGDVSQELVELLVVADGELDVAGHDAALLVVTGSVAGKLEDLGSQVLKHGGKVHGGTSTDTGSISASLEEAANTADRELKSSLGTARSALLASDFAAATLSTLSSFSRHFELI